MPVMHKSFFQIQSRSATRIAGLAAGVVCSVLLPFCLLDETACKFYQNRSGNSVFMNAVLFYSGYNSEVRQQITPNPDRYIAIVTYIGIQENAGRGSAKSSVDEIIRDHVIPAFERKGLKFEHETNKITNVRLYYNKEYIGKRDEPDVRVFCFVTSRAAFALVVV